MADDYQTSGGTNSDTTPTSAIGIFPDAPAEGRLNDYKYYEELFMGHHFDAFNLKIEDERWKKEYAKLRYVMVNFAGLVSKIVADMLFTESVTIKVPEGDQDFVDGLWEENKMNIQCYESALSNSYLGDALFKLRIGPREGKTESTVIIEDTTPSIYFPEINGFNVKADPLVKTLAWTFMSDGKKYLRKEIHTPGKIENKVYLMEGNKIMSEVGIDILGIPGLLPVIATGLDVIPLIHVPNWKTGNRYFGISDYFDLTSLFYAINNRMTKVDNILDKHGDPILQVPTGVIDENGNVKKKALGVIEVADGEKGVEYVVWDAKLESAFTEIQKLVEFMYLVSEISPDVLGLGQGVSDSGRALKFKLMRTIAKTARKRLYYDRAIKDVLYLAQVWAKKMGIKVNGKTLQGEPVYPEIDWADGLPIDMHEQLEDEVTAVDAGLTSKKAAIMRVYKVDEEAAEKMMKEEREENELNMPKMDMGNGNPFNKNQTQPMKPMDNQNMTKPIK